MVKSQEDNQREEEGQADQSSRGPGELARVKGRESWQQNKGSQGGMGGRRKWQDRPKGLGEEWWRRSIWLAMATDPARGWAKGKRARGPERQTVIGREKRGTGVTGCQGWSGRKGSRHCHGEERWRGEQSIPRWSAPEKLKGWGHGDMECHLRGQGDQRGAKLGPCVQRALDTHSWNTLSPKENPRKCHRAPGPHLLLPPVAQETPPPPQVLPSMDVSQWPYLSWKPPRGAESSGSKGLRGQSAGGGIWSSLPGAQGLCGELSGLSSSLRLQSLHT